MAPEKNHFILSCESTADLIYSEFDKRNIPFICYTYMADGQEYSDTMGRDPHEKQRFYALVDRGILPSTSRINPELYLSYFESLPEEGDLVHITLGTGMTGSYTCALQAAEEYRALHPQRQIYVIDSLCSSAGYGLLMTLAADIRDSGADTDTFLAKLDPLRTRIQHRFFCTDLAFFKRSGRVNGISAAVGTLLNLCPLMCLNRAGQIVMFGKCRGVHKAARKTAEDMLLWAENGADYDGLCYINHSRCPEYAAMMEKEIVRLMPRLEGRIRIFDIGPVIASHCGPGTCTIYFMGKNIRDE